MAARNAPDQLWFIPSILTTAAIAMALLLVWIDTKVSVSAHSQWWLFGGTADGARTLLQVVAGSLISVIAIAFSLTIIAFQQAANLYTPRVLRNFSSDRGNQVVLGTYIATFVYSVLVLRQVRSPTSSLAEFVPAFSMLADLVLALVSLGMLIYFIHHVTESIQVSQLLSLVSDAARAELDRLFPDRLAPDGADAEPYRHAVERLTRARGDPSCIVHLAEEGYVRQIDEDRLLALCRGIDLAILDVGVGDFVADGAPIMQLWSSGPLDHRLAQRIRNALLVDRTPSIEQDVGFGFQQIVDIALKALSPAVNDPATAEQAIDHLGSLLGRLSERRGADPCKAIDDTCLVFRRERFEVLAETSLRQVRYAAHSNLRVTLRLLRVMSDVATRAATRERGLVLATQAHEILAELPRAGFSAADEALVSRAVDEMLACVDHPEPTERRWQLTAASRSP